MREHIHFSNDVKDNLPAAVTAIDTSIHAFSTEIGVRTFQFQKIIFHSDISLESMPRTLRKHCYQGYTDHNGLEARLVDVNNALLKLIDVLTKNNLAENLKVGQDKYQGINIPGISKVSQYCLL